jgi:hypothetical protein
MCVITYTRSQLSGPEAQPNEYDPACARDLALTLERAVIALSV